MKKSFSIKRIAKASLPALLLLTQLASMAQERPKVFGKPVNGINPKNGLIRCVSAEYDAYQRETNIKGESRDEFENWMRKKVAETKLQRNANSTTEIITIPVVVHVIHNGDNVGSNENIATAQILSQITVLNQDFRKMAGTPGFNTEEAGADIEIEFCLAQVDPAGNATTGIDRINLNRASWTSMDQINEELKPQTIWDPEQYFNIWVCNLGGQAQNILGYAQFPNTNATPGLGTQNGGPDTDGVVIGYRYFGSSALYPQGVYTAPYNRGRTATHEVGHALGLVHIWGDGGSQRDQIIDCNATDFCDDTPFAGWDNYECDGVTDTCPDSPGLDMTNNYMDYTDDVCMNTFTQDQKLRIITVMNNAPRRASLKTSTVCQPLAASKDFGLLNAISIYPNPAQAVLNLNVENGELPDGYTIYNSLGQTIAAAKITGSASLSINTSGYSSGIYFIKVDKGQESKTLKFIKD